MKNSIHFKIYAFIFVTVVLSLVIRKMNGQNISTEDFNRIPQNNEPIYKLVWYDDFTFLDTSKWKVNNNDDHWGKSAAVKIDDNVSIEQQDYLKIDIKKESYQCPATDDYYCITQKGSGDPNFEYKYTSGAITSKCGYEMDNGYMEARIQFPREPGSWTSFWAYRTDCNNPNAIYGEIDVVEVWPHKFTGNSDNIQTNIHICVDCNNPYGGEMYNLPVNTDVSDWHIYAAKWNEHEIKFYLDGLLIRTEQNNHVNLEQKFDMLLSAFVGFGYNDSIKHSNFTSSTISMFVDWVRVYEEEKDCVSQFIKPYLVNSKADPVNQNKSKVSLIWQLPCGTNVDSCRVDWGTTEWSYTNGETINDDGISHFYEHEFTDLQPNTKYFYRILFKNDDSIIDVYTGSFISAPDENETNISFYASGNTVKHNIPNSSSQFDEVSTEITNQISSDPNSQTFLIQTGDFVTADNIEYWINEYFNGSLINAYQLRLKLPIISPVSKNLKKYHLLNANMDNLYEEYYRGKNYRDYFPYDYIYPYSHTDPVTGYPDYDYHYSVKYGPVNILMPEIIDINTNKGDIMLYPTNKDWNILSFNTALKSLNGDVLNAESYNKIKQFAITNNVQLILMSSENYYAHWVDNGIHFMVIGNGGVNTNSIDDSKIDDNELVYASTVPHFAKFKIDGDMMYVDVIQGADDNGYSKGRVVESFAIPKTQIISNNTVWQTDSVHPVISDYVSINSNANLDINSEVQFFNGVLKVRKEATLGLNNQNTLLTTHPGFTENIDFKTFDASGNVTNTYLYPYTRVPIFWDGIFVEGIPYFSQNTYNQGYVHISNGATIEHALSAITIKEVVTENGVIKEKGGGVLHADNAIFKDNITDIKMYPYQNFFTYQNGTTINLADRTKIENSTLRTTNDFIGTTDTIKHIDLSWVNGVRIRGNTFINENTNLSRNEMGIGITSSNSSFRAVEQYKITDPKNKNTFENLFYGITTSGWYDNSSIQIKGNDFIDVYRGIKLVDSKYAEILNNYFEVSDINPNVPLTYPWLAPYGIYLYGGNGFKVEDNEITSFNNSTGIHGIVVSSTGAENNQIYKNNLSDLNVGIQPQFQNRGTISNNNQEDGLKLICNTYDNPGYDSWVAGKNFSGGAKGIGIAKYQQVSVIDNNGHQKYVPAGNVFSPTANHPYGDTTVHDFDYSNKDAEHLEYHYWDNATDKEIPYFYSNIALQADNNKNTCPSSTPQTISDLYVDLSAAQTALNSSKLMLDIWENGGNAELDEEVETIAPWDVYVEFNNLMAESPYLSEDVIISVIENESFTALMVKLLMIANPHVINSDEVMGVLYDRIPPLPQSYIDEILNEGGDISQLDLLRADVAADQHLVSKTGNDIKRKYRNDTTNAYALDSLISFMSRQQELSARYELASVYLTHDMFDEMNTCLNNIPDEFELSDEEYQDYQDYLTLFDMADDIKQAGVGINQLDSNQIDILIALADNNRPGISAFAISLLRDNDPGFIWNEIVLKPDEEAKSGGGAKEEFQTPTDNDKMFNIYPNPAYDFVTAAYDVDAQAYEQLTVVIYNTHGKKVLEHPLQDYYNEVIIDLTTLSVGIYYVSLVGDGQRIATKKLNLID